MIVWIDGTFGVGKTAIAAELMRRHPESSVIEFDEFAMRVKHSNPMELYFGKCYPESKRCYVDAFADEIEKSLNRTPQRYSLFR